MKTTLTLSLVLAAGLAMPAAGQDRPATSDPLAAGVRQLEGGDLEGAVASLGAAVRQLAGDRQRTKDLAIAHLYLSMAHLGLDDPSAARRSMVDALAADSDLKVDAKRFPPRVRKLHEEVKAELKAGRTVAAQQAAAPPPAPAVAAPAPAPPALAPPAPARAVPALPLTIGARVRVAAPATGNKTVIGTLVRSDGQTLVIERESSREGVSIPAASVTRLDVSRRRPGKAWVGGLVGLGVGAGAGAAYGNGGGTRDQFYDQCVADSRTFGFPADTCLGPKRGVGKWAAIGGGSGLLIGGIIGKLTGKERWEAVPQKQVWIAPLGFRGVQIAVVF